MNIDKILSEFSRRRGYFPKAAVEAAIAQQEVITPYLLASLENAAGPLNDDDANEALTLFALYLLAQFREQKAYPLIIRMVSIPAMESEYRFGDIVTEGLHRVLATVYNGDLTLLQALIENDSDGIDEFVQGAALRTIATLCFTGQVDRDSVRQYLTRLFRGRLRRRENHVWNVLVDVTAEMGFRELLADIQLAYKHGLADSFYRKPASIENTLESATDQPRRARDGQLIDDAIAELQDRATFRPIQATAKHQPPTPQPQLLHTGETLKREIPKTGRNDPCPCGSGKKFKKCCGR